MRLIMTNLYKVFNVNSMVNLGDSEITSVNKVIDKLVSLNVLVLLTAVADRVIDDMYQKYIDDGTYSLQTAMSKIHSRIEHDDDLADIYSEMCSETYVFYKKLDMFVSDELYELYVNQGDLNIADNFNKSFFKVITYHSNIIKG